MVQLLATVLEQRAPSPRKFRPEVPQGLAKAVLRCLEKQPTERFKTYAELTEAIAPYSSTAPTRRPRAALRGWGDRYVSAQLDNMAILLPIFGNPLKFF